MTEVSRVWDGTTTGDASDAPYDSSEMAEIWQALAAAEAVPTNKSGVFRGVDNILGYTIGANKITINTGKALVSGRYYKNTASLDITVSDATVGRRDRIVLRRDVSGQTVRLTRVAGVDNGSGVAPALTQNNSTWDEPLYTINKAAGVGAAISLISDDREYIPRHGDVSGEGGAAVHAYSQISGRPLSADSVPVNAGLLRTPSAGSDTGHYANDDHVHAVDPFPSAHITSDVLNTVTTPVTVMSIVLPDSGIYFVEAVLSTQGEPGGVSISGGTIIGYGVGTAIGTSDTNQALAINGGCTANFNGGDIVRLNAVIQGPGTVSLTLGRQSNTPFGNLTAVQQGSYMRAIPTS